MLVDYKVLGHNLHINCAFGHRLIKHRAPEGQAPRNYGVAEGGPKSATHTMVIFPTKSE
jgi:hypothetical protein